MKTETAEHLGQIVYHQL